VEFVLPGEVAGGGGLVGADEALFFFAGDGAVAAAVEAFAGFETASPV
jgi:hypothetical protein